MEVSGVDAAWGPFKAYQSIHKKDVNNLELSEIQQ